MPATKMWDEILVEEHEMIERALDVLKRELENIPPDKCDLFAMQRSIDFLLEFGDRIHNTKEETILFPRMVERGIPEHGPIRVMLMEHDSERNLLQQMFNHIPSLGSMSLKQKNKYMEQGMSYLDIRSNHIWKENDVLFKMGQKVFSEEDKKYLVEKFQAINVSAYGNEAEDKFHQMMKEVERGKKARKSLIHNLSMEQIDAIMETLPFEVTFVDADDTVAYFNRLDKEKIFVRSRSVVGRKVQKCHPAKSVDQVQRIVDGFKNGSMDKAEFWIDFKGDKILISYLPVHDENGNYQGVLEVTQQIADIQKIEGEKRLLD